MLEWYNDVLREAEKNDFIMLEDDKNKDIHADILDGKQIEVVLYRNGDEDHDDHYSACIDIFTEEVSE